MIRPKNANSAPRIKAPHVKTLQKMVAFAVYEKMYESTTQSDKQLNKKAESKFFGDGQDDQGFIGNLLNGIGRFQHLRHVDPLSSIEVFSSEFKGVCLQSNMISLNFCTLYKYIFYFFANCIVIAGLECSLFNKTILRRATLSGPKDIEGRTITNMAKKTLLLEAKKWLANWAEFTKNGSTSVFFFFSIF